MNKNAIPFDTVSVFKAGGIRVGTPAVTTRGMKEEEMMEIADLIHEALQGRGNPDALRKGARDRGGVDAAVPAAVRRAADAPPVSLDKSRNSS